MEDAFEIGKEIVEERHGEFKNKPEEFHFKSGLLEQSMAAHTQSTIPMNTISGDGENNAGTVVFYSKEAEPHTITVDEHLANHHPEKATKSLLHELYEWRAAEVMPSDQVLQGNTDFIAEFNENSLCREVNERLGNEVCDESWNNEYET